MTDAAIGNLRDVHHAAHAFGDLDKGAVIFQRIHFAFNHRASGIVFADIVPGIAIQRLDRQRDALLAAIAQTLGAEHDDFDLLPLREHIFGFFDALMTHLGNVNHTFDTCA